MINTQPDIYAVLLVAAKTVIFNCPIFGLGRAD